MKRGHHRRTFLTWSAASSLAWMSGRVSPGADRRPLSERPDVPDHRLVTIEGSARERGRKYGKQFAGPIHDFFRERIEGDFVPNQTRRNRLLRYAAACIGPIRRLSVEWLEELEGMAEGSGLRLEEQILLTLHEELWHRGEIPSLPHCTALALGPPDTADGHTYVAQSWDWYRTLCGKSQMLKWKRPDGPSAICYSYPGLRAGAGVNSAGIALCWTSVLDKTVKGPAVGVPTYILIAHLLAQPSLAAVREEAKRAKQAGWFTFVLGDRQGNLLNIEASPERIVFQSGKGTLARVYYGTPEMTGTPAGKSVELHPQCRRMLELVESARSQGKIDRQQIERFYSDHATRWICKHFNTLDVMIYDATEGVAHVTRGPGCLARYRSFALDEGRALKAD